MLRFLALPLLLTYFASIGSSQSDVATPTTYRVQQNVVLSDIASNAKHVDWWVAVPDDDRYQEVLDIDVIAAPGPWKVVRDTERGNRFLMFEVDSPGSSSITARIEFVVRRRAAHVDIDAARVGFLTAAQKTLFADELVTDAPHMQANDDVKKMADFACGNEKNLAVQASKLLNAVAEYADHYSKDPTKPKCGVGDASDCLTNKGGCCTDLHSLFIALARHRGIPARLQMGYRLLEKNEGKEVDPGYRCWAEYFLPGYGWVPADIVEADATGGLGPAVWFNGLTDRRLWLNEGREFDLPGRKNKARVNTMVIGYAEIDGVPARVLPEGEKPAQLSRTVLFTTVAPKKAAPTTGG